MKKSVLFTLFLVLISFICSPAFANETATKDECVAMCNKALDIAKTKGVDEMLRKIGEAKGPFVWKDSYIYAINLDNNQVAAHPIKPVLVGKNLSGIKDINGKMFFVEIINLAKEKGEGWVDYMWPKPGEKKPSPKDAFVIKVPGAPYAISAGIYK